MSDITLITPPDKVFNKNKSILLVYPSDQSRNEIQNILAELKDPINVYLYNEDVDIDWLLTTHKFCDVVFLDIDNFPAEMSKLTSFLVSFSNTFWLTKGEHLYYNKLSNKRVYDYNFLNATLGGDNFAEQ